MYNNPNLTLAKLDPQKCMNYAYHDFAIQGGCSQPRRGEREEKTSHGGTSNLWFADTEKKKEKVRKFGDCQQPLGC